MNELKRTKEWFNLALPDPTIEQACIQIGCHYEEVSEMLTALVDDRDGDNILDIATEYKQCSRENLPYIAAMNDTEKTELLDAMVDQIVTAIGVCHTMGFDVERALAEVNRSNFSKLEDGKPVFDVNGKITKGKNYTPPELGEFIK